METKKRKLNDGNEIPLIGLRCGRMDNPIEVIYNSIKDDVRLLDTGVRYENQKIIGEGVKKH